MMELGSCGVGEDIIKADREDHEEEEEVVLPGFRFHPTDEELVGFYLLRKVQGKSINFELIKQVDIYKYDPWDLPKLINANSDDEKEWYFFCMRGRKYRNSVRPNRVTGTGFWKATGIDKPICSSSKCNVKYHVIGLKKSLVYYLGSAGKGIKTEWMMHEFRLPVNDLSASSEEAEVWTLCRIFKRNTSSKKCTTKWEHPINKKISLGDSNSTTCSLESTKSTGNYINHLQESRSHFTRIPEEILIVRSPITSSSSSLWTSNDDEFFGNGNWDELGLAINWGSTVHSNSLLL